MSYCIELTFIIPANTASANVSLPIKKSNGVSPTWSGANYIYWADGSPVYNYLLTHTFPNVSVQTSYLVQVMYPNTAADAVVFNNSSTTSWTGAQYLTSVNSWGTTWGNFTGAFLGATSLTSVPAALPAGVQSTSAMFRQASIFNDPNISTWITSAVKYFDAMFLGATNFNQNIGNWDTSNVGTGTSPSGQGMSYMFYGATNFNQDISNWDTTNVKNMSYMFYGAAVFNQDISNWDTHSVTNMQQMFYGATAFNNGSVTNDQLHPMITSGNKWKTSSVNTMSSMFGVAYAFNQDIGNWDTSSVTNTSSMFGGASVFNQDISNWDTHLVTNMNFMFPNALDFNNGGVSMATSGNKWKTSAVTSMIFMFNGTNFNQNINNWDTSSVTDMSGMFYYAAVFNQDISNWDTHSVTNMQQMFSTTSNFNNGGVSMATNGNKWKTSAVTNMLNMFNYATNFNQNINNWDTSAVNSMNNMFGQATVFNQDIGNWTITSVTDMTSMLNDTGITYPVYDNILNGWALQNVQNGVPLGAFGLYYSNYGAIGRNILTNTYSWDITGDNVTCFNKGTKILCYSLNDDQYIPIEDIKVGTLVKTYLHGYRKVILIGFKSSINNPKNPLQCMYQCDDLIVTGGHSVLTHNWIYSQFRKDRKKLDNHFLTLACASNKFTQLVNNDRYTYYHFVLESENDKTQFGIWAENILCETQSKEDYLQNFEK